MPMIYSSSPHNVTDAFSLISTFYMPIVSSNFPLYSVSDSYFPTFLHIVIFIFHVTTTYPYHPSSQISCF